MKGPIARVTDAAVRAAFPGWALRREQARNQLAIVEHQRKAIEQRQKMGAFLGSYSGTSRGRLHSDWTPHDTSADAALLDDLPELRSRSSDLVRNDPIAAAVVRVVTDNVVGSGLRPQSRVDHERLGITKEQAERFQEQAEAAWERAAKYLDASGRTDAYGLQALAVRQMVECGESLSITMLVRDPNRPTETVVDVIEPHRLATPDELASDPKIRDGVVLGSRSQPIAYWIGDRHPGDVGLYGFERVKYRRVKAWASTGRRQVLHAYQVKRPGQTRGEPWLAPILSLLRHRAEYEQSMLVRARAEASIAAVVTNENGEPPPGMTGMSSMLDAYGNPTEELSAGQVHYAPPGSGIAFHAPQSPGSTFDPFMLYLIRAAATAAGVSYELLMNDFSRTNYSSARASLLESRRSFRRTQQTLITCHCQPAYEAVLEEAILKGEIEAPTFFDPRLRDEWCRATWIAPPSGWIDPTKEVQASKDAIDAGLSTLAEECAGQGRDWHDVQRQLRREHTERMTAGLGIDVETYARAVRAGMLTPQQSDEEFIRDVLVLPVMGDDVRAAWIDEGGARRPITLTQPADEDIPGVTAPSESAAPAQPEEQPAVITMRNGVAHR